MKIVKDTKPELNLKNYYSFIGALVASLQDCLSLCRVSPSYQKHADRTLDIIELLAHKFHDGVLYNKSYTIQNELALHKSSEASDNIKKLADNVDFLEKRNDLNY